MRFTVKVADGKTLTFASQVDLANHYGTLANAHRRNAEDANRRADIRLVAKGKAEAYDIICWQIGQMKIEP